MILPYRHRQRETGHDSARRKMGAVVDVLGLHGIGQRQGWLQMQTDWQAALGDGGSSALNG